MPRTFPKGGEWRVWDFQVHTPFSELNNGFGDDLNSYATSFFRKAIAKNVAVVGVTDYFSVDGYKFLKELQKDAGRLAALFGPNADLDEIVAAQQILLLPNIELRSDILVNGNRVNYHIIFADDIPIEEIEAEFLCQLSFKCEGIPSGVDQKRSLTKRNLEAYGKELKAHHADFSSKSDLFVGMMQATVADSEVSNILKARESVFKGRYLFCVPADEDLSKVSWNSQGHSTRKILIQKSHVLFASNGKTRDFSLGLLHDAPEAFLKEFGAFKPCVHGSDAHTIEELFEPDEERRTWIKADPTFAGLQQVLNEPADRVYVGEMPDGLTSVASRPTRILDRIKIQKMQGSALSEAWFNQEFSLNPELVAIIGNKGSGKSALADIIGLIGDTGLHEQFSFLAPTRFRDRKNNKAKHFETTGTWSDGSVTGPISLDATPQDGAVERVKYIPQEYLEKICNEVSLGAGSRFYDELQKVIFSHVSSAEQLGCSSLDELLSLKSEQRLRTIGIHLQQLNDINRELASLDEKLTESHQKALDAQIVAKQRELDAHDANPVPEVPKPVTQSADHPAVAALEASLQQVASHSAAIAKKNQELERLTKRRSACQRILQKLANLQLQVDSVRGGPDPDILELGVSWDDVLSFRIHKEPLAAIEEEIDKSFIDLLSDLNEATPDSLAARHAEAKGRVATISL